MDVNVDRMSFHQNRMAYGITLDDVAKKAGLAVSTVGAYERFTSKYTETRTRDENAARIENALKEVIQEKLAETFSNAINIKKESDMVYSREVIGNKIKKFCKDSHIVTSQFISMCGLDLSSFAPSTIRKSAVLSKGSVQKILSATGWPEYYLTDENDIPVSKETCKTYDQSKYVPPVEVCKTNAKLISEGPIGKIFDEKLISQDGRYFHEYKCTYIRKEEVTKEQFINLINKKEEN